MTAQELIAFGNDRMPPVTLDSIGQVVLEAFIWGHNSRHRAVVAVKWLAKNLHTSWPVDAIEEPKAVSRSVFGLHSAQAPCVEFAMFFQLESLPCL